MRLRSELSLNVDGIKKKDQPESSKGAKASPVEALSCYFRGPKIKPRAIPLLEVGRQQPICTAVEAVARSPLTE
jgi:hypothetical protein